MGACRDRRVWEVLPQKAVDASMSSGLLVPCDLVLPGCLIGGHRSVDDVDEVALEDALGAAFAFGGFVAGQEFLCRGVEAFLYDGSGVKDAVEASVAASMQAMAFVVGGVDRNRGAPGVASELGRPAESGDVADLGD